VPVLGTVRDCGEKGQGGGKQVPHVSGRSEDAINHMSRGRSSFTIAKDSLVQFTPTSVLLFGLSPTENHMER